MTLPDPGMPILLLNRPSDLAALKAMNGPIQAIGLLPEEEAELAAIQALVLGHRRALVLAQSTEWGQRVAEAFESTFRLGGGRILQSAEYATLAGRSQRLAGSSAGTGQITAAGQ